MNETRNDFQMRLDRLVDGELSPAEYAALLASFDRQPDTWRSCALAFLESQALHTSCRSLVELKPAVALPSVAQPAAAIKSEVAKNQDAFRPLSQFGALAAALLLTFLLGRGSVSRSIDTSPGAPQFVADRPAETGSAIAAEKEPRAPAAMNRGKLSLVVDDGQGKSQHLEIPVLDGKRVDSRRLLNQPQLSSEISDALRARGRDVESRREVYPLDRGDGTRVLVPIDRIRVVPSARPGF